MDKKTINQLIKNFKADQLQELIFTIVKNNPSAQQALLDYCQEKGKTSKTEEYAIVIENQLKHHWAKASGIIDEFNMYGGGPEDEEEIACNELEEMREILESEEVAWELRREILDDVLSFIYVDNSGLIDILTDVAYALCKTKAENIYLADQMSEKETFTEAAGEL